MEESIAEELGFHFVEIPADCTQPADVLRQLVDALVTEAVVPAAAIPALTRLVLAPNAIRYAHLSWGIALARARHPAIGVLGGVVGRCASPVAWPSQPALPPGPVRTAVLIVGPDSQPGAYLHLASQTVTALIPLAHAAEAEPAAAPDPAAPL